MTDLVNEVERRREWHSDRRAIMAIIVSIILGFIVQTATLVGTGLWWGGGIETKQAEHSRRLVEHDAALRILSVSQERIVRLEPIVERLERVTTRLEDRLNNGKSR